MARSGAASAPGAGLDAGASASGFRAAGADSTVLAGDWERPEGREAAGGFGIEGGFAGALDSGGAAGAGLAGTGSSVETALS